MWATCSVSLILAIWFAFKFSKHVSSAIALTISFMSYNPKSYQKSHNISLGKRKGRASHKLGQRWEATKLFQNSHWADLIMLLNLSFSSSSSFTSSRNLHYLVVSPSYHVCPVEIIAQLEHGRLTALKLPMVQRQKVSHPSLSVLSYPWEQRAV